MSKKASLITVSVTMGITIAGLLAALIIFITTTNVYATQLENTYMRSFYELSSNVSDIEIDLSKLIATNSSLAQKELLTDIYNTTNIANTNISNMPVSSNNIKDINTFVNKLGGFSFSLLEKLDKNIKFSDADLVSISELHSHSFNLLYEFNRYISGIKFDYKILSQVDYNNEQNSGLNGTFNNIQGSNSKVPTLIYDGPFADSLLNPDIKGLTGDEITKETAEGIIRDKFTMYTINSINFVNDTEGMFKTYNFNVETNEAKLFVQITKKGGHVLEITSSSKIGQETLTKKESEDLARSFARSLGYNNIYPVWSMVNGTVAYVNLAPIVDGTIYYPDLIKVKVDRSQGVVSGWEAKNYFFNHTKRSLPTPAISFATAQSKLSSQLTVIEKNKALIPNKFAGETLTYEFVCTWKNYTYYVYIDALTGQEANILRIIKTNSGDLIM